MKLKRTDQDLSDLGPSEDDLDRFCGETIRCPSCGGEILDEASLCPTCLEPVTNRRGRRPMVRVAVVVIIVVMILRVLQRLI